VTGVITASERSWTVPFTGLSPRQFSKLITALRREGVDPVHKGRPWSLPLEDRVLLVAAYWRTNLTLRRLALLFGVSKSAADRIFDHLGPSLALQQRRRFRKDTVLIVDGTLVPARDHERLPEMSEALITWAAITLMTRRLTRRKGRPAERCDVAHGYVMPEAA